MTITRFKKQKMGVVANTHPDLWKTINTHFKDENEELKGEIAGLIIEYVIKSGGDVDIFQDGDVMGISSLETSDWED